MGCLRRSAEDGSYCGELVRLREMEKVVAVMVRGRFGDTLIVRAEGAGEGPTQWGGDMRGISEDDGECLNGDEEKR
ncbi:hypothetical protein V6N13_106977 [Hibiscus sabdariffa]